MTPPEYAKAIAAEVRAEMARQRKTAGDLASALGVTPATAGKRLQGASEFTITEVVLVAQWLGVEPSQFYPSTTAMSVEVSA